MLNLPTNLNEVVDDSLSRDNSRDMTLSTTLPVSALPVGMRAAVAFLNPSTRDVKIEARETTWVSSNSQTYTAANVLVPNLDSKTTVTRTGVWGGNNGFNRPPADRNWDPVFDETSHEVPLDGAIVYGLVGKRCVVVVHPTTFATRFCKDEIARDAIIDGRLSEATTILSETNGLSLDECAALYALRCYKSCERRTQLVKALASAVDSCVTKGLVKRASNGATQITTAGKALEDDFRARGQARVYEIERTL